jgi:hypothetical protein
MTQILIALPRTKAVKAVDTLRKNRRCQSMRITSRRVPECPAVLFSGSGDTLGGEEPVAHWLPGERGAVLTTASSQSAASAGSVA